MHAMLRSGASAAQEAPGAIYHTIATPHSEDDHHEAPGCSRSFTDASTSHGVRSAVASTSLVLYESPTFRPHDCRREHCYRVTINVAGQRYETQLKTLERFPETLLGCPAKREAHWDGLRQEYFFDRHRPSFAAILHFYQSGGRLVRPPEVPDDIFYEEIKFFEFPANTIREYLLTEGYILQRMRRVPTVNWRTNLWNFLEYPDSSLGAKFLGLFSISMIIVSVVTFCVETMPEFGVRMCRNVTYSSGKIVSKGNYRDASFIIESCCILWFTLELAFRFIVYPWSKRQFLRSFMNILDGLAILPYFITVIAFEVLHNCADVKKSNSLAVLRVVRLLRVLRVFKLSKYVSGLRVLGKTLQMSMHELGMFIFFLVICVILFATGAYMAELNHESSPFSSIPDAFWWAVVSMTTVGYGDYVPKGIAGKFVGSICVIAGVLTIALPVPVVVTNFNTVYKQTSHRRSRPEVVLEKS